MSNYPPARAAVPNGDEDQKENDSDEEEEEEEEEEELLEWTELMPLEELNEMEDGPSTYIVGGYSSCRYLGEATSLVKYKEDIVIVFPGIYSEAWAPSADPVAQMLELNEAQLGGLRIYGARYAREHAGAERDDGSSSPKYATRSKHRVGPWFTWLTAAATATLLTQEGSGEAPDANDGDNNAGGARAPNPLKTAAIRAVAATDTQTSSNSMTPTTTSGFSVFAPAISATTANAAHHPVFDFPISVVYVDDESETFTGGLPHYKQELSDEEAEEEDDDENANNNNRNGGEEDDEDGNGLANQASNSASAAALRNERAITLAGCCARGGLTLGSLTRTTVTHCVIGTSQSSAAQPSALRTALTAASLTEAVVDHCLVYGGTSYGVYAFPRAALTLQSCLVEGPNAEAERACGGSAPGESDAASAAGLSPAFAGSVIEQLEHRRARAQRLQAFLQRNEEAEGGGYADNGEDAGGSGSAYVDVEDGVLPRFAVPQTSPSCEVGVMCDDADVRIEDCLVSHTRLGVLLHGGCAGTKVRWLDIRSCTEAGLYIYGVGGAAEVLNSCVRACGRACLLLVGPSAAEVEQAAAALGMGESAADDDGEEEEDEEAGSSGGQRRAVLEQHPHLKLNTFLGSVRVQGEVRCGAVVNNYVFLPKEEKSAAAVATAAETLLSLDAPAPRGFTYVGVEGDRVIGRAADQVAAA
ncbi:hypothetical protein ABL78_7734 [Leptomonas seymouri]|uniref:Right handed beta helix domain-containing protein n=1 Tax=Leptomonas seymouri TaxID=5684 RepID=A0A0N1I055_LEPSE|nr:hypothetical protein ABL78_7734 [Leptomonas seymouri]|eukprot:KPI83244.1 hypothetical protein ABL78_7734 [Leptomonas seymouri]